MVDRSREISQRTFFKRCDWQDFARNLSYSVGAEKGLHLKDDFCVSYHKSYYRGKLCYYLVNSAIEWIFLAPR